MKRKETRSLSHSKTLKGRFKRYKYLYLLIFPGLLFFIVFKYIPMYGVVIAFQDYLPFKGGFKQIILEPNWIGFKHFSDFFSSFYFWRLLRNTLVLAFLGLVFGFPGPIILALFIDELRHLKFKKLVQTISYLPHFLSWVIIAGLISTLLSPTTGPINAIIMKLGGQPISFLGDPRYFRGVLVFSGVWRGIGWGTIIYLAAIAGIDPGLYESAVLEGANRWQKWIHISIPSITHIIVLLLILRLGDILDVGFEKILLLYSVPVYRVADVIDTFVYREGIINARYSYSTAIGMFKNIVGLFLIVISNWGAKKMGREGLW